MLLKGDLKRLTAEATKREKEEKAAREEEQKRAARRADSGLGGRARDRAKACRHI